MFYVLERIHCLLTCSVLTGSTNDMLLVVIPPEETGVLGSEALSNERWLCNSGLMMFTYITIVFEGRVSSFFFSLWALWRRIKNWPMDCYILSYYLPRPLSATSSFTSCLPDSYPCSSTATKHSVIVKHQAVTRLRLYDVGYPAGAAVMQTGST